MKDRRIDYDKLKDNLINLGKEAKTAMLIKFSIYNVNKKSM